MYSILFALASLFYYSTSIQCMDNNKDLAILAEEALSDGGKFVKFCKLCDHGAFDDNVLSSLIEKQNHLNKQSRKSILPGDEVYISYPQNTSELINQFFLRDRMDQMIRSLKISRLEQQQSPRRLIDLPDHKIEKNRK